MEHYLLRLDNRAKIWHIMHNSHNVQYRQGEQGDDYPGFGRGRDSQ